MLERFHLVLKLVCLGLTGLIVMQLVRIVRPPGPPVQATFSTSLLPQSAAAALETNQSSLRTNSPSAPLARTQPEVPSAVQARVDRILQSEILGPMIRPLPMALLGLGGNDAFLRAPNGQTGLLRVGEELGGVKLLQIGTNRVLVEHDRVQQELMLFSGLGSDSLLPAKKPTPK